MASAQGFKDWRSRESYYVRARLGPISTNKLRGGWWGDGQIQVNPQVLLVPLGSLLSNVVWRLEQVSRESLEEIIFPWDSR